MKIVRFSFLEIKEYLLYYQPIEKADETNTNDRKYNV